MVHASQMNDLVSGVAIPSRRRRLTNGARATDTSAGILSKKGGRRGNQGSGHIQHYIILYLLRPLLVCAIIIVIRPHWREEQKSTGHSWKPRLLSLQQSELVSSSSSRLSTRTIKEFVNVADLANDRKDKNKAKNLLATYKNLKTYKNNGIPERPTCKFFDWQTMQYPTCNNIHELMASPYNLKYLASGSQSSVFQLSRSSPIVLKTQKYTGKYVEGFTQSSYGRRRVEVMVMERLTSSPYVADLWGFCGMAVVAPVAVHGDLLDYVNSVRNGGDELKTIDKLKVGYQVAEGLAALHGIDPVPSLSHNDLDISQHVYEDGVFKINDFGYGKMLRHDPTRDGLPCTDTSYPLEAWKYRSPQDLRSIMITGERIRLDVADVFSLGTELYMVLTNKWLWEGERREKSCHRLIEGERPPLPSKYTESKDKAIVALRTAIEMCWEQSSTKRASARQVADFLRNNIDTLISDGRNTKHIVKVDIPTLVKTGNSYDDNM